jgi:hypothetical protein
MASRSLSNRLAFGGNGGIGVEQYAPFLDAHWKARRASHVRRRRAPVIKTDDPIVQGTRHSVAEHNTLRERPALVRTSVEQGEHGVVISAKHRYLGSIRTPYAARA